MAPSKSSARSCDWVARDVRLSRRAPAGCSSPAPPWPIFMAVLVARALRAGQRRAPSGPGRRRRAAARLCLARRAWLHPPGVRPVRAWARDALRAGADRCALPHGHRRAASAAIAADRDGGLKPFMVIGTAGTVDTGAIDDLAAIAAICAREKLWFHIDGAYGALGMLSPEIAPRLKGMRAGRFHRLRFPQMGPGAL